MSGVETKEAKEQREDSAILATLRQVRAEEFAGALARSWGRNAKTITALSAHLTRTGDEVVALLSVAREEQVLDSGCQVLDAVVELTVTFPGLNLASLRYIVVVNFSHVSISPCQSSCEHPDGAIKLVEEHLRDAEFGINLSGLHDAIKTSLPNVDMMHLSELLRASNVFFWPLVRVLPGRLVMEKVQVAGVVQAADEAIRLVTSAKRRKVRGKASMEGAAGISLVGLKTPTVLWRHQETRRRKLQMDRGRCQGELRAADNVDTPELIRRDDVSIKKVMEKMIPIADIHARIPHCETKYTYYGTHDHIMKDEETGKEEEPLLYNDSGQLKLSSRQLEVLHRLVATIGTSPNNWTYCCWIFFKKFHNFVATGSNKYEADVLEVYLKMQYFALLKKRLPTSPFSRGELEQIKILLKYFWANSTVICNHFANRSPESVCKEMERLQKGPRLEGCFLVSLRIRPNQLAGTEECLLEHLQEELSVLVAGTAEEVHLLPCSHSSIVCPHRTFKRIPELLFPFDFDRAAEEEDAFQSFLLDTANSQLPSIVNRSYLGPTLAALVAGRTRDLYTLPCSTLFRLNGAKRLRDAGFKMVESCQPNQ